MMLHCLGTTGYHPSATRHTACYYLPDLGLVFDAGTGIFRLVEELRKNPRESITILLSHAHLDHIVGLTFLIDAVAVTSLRHIRVVGEEEKLNAVQEHLYNELLFPVQPPFDFEPLPTAPASIFMELEHHLNGHTAKLTCFPLEHPGKSLGYCLEFAGKKIAYVTDTIARPEADYLRYLADTDLLLHECYFDDSQRQLSEKTGHSWLSAVTDVVRKTKPRRTALVHINPLAEVMDQGIELTETHRQELNMLVAEDGMQLEI